MKCDFEKNIELVGENFGQDLSYNLDSSKLNKQTGWKDKINLENISAARKKTIRDELKSLEIQANLAAQRTPLNVFMTNLQSRIYSELSKQVTEQLFADTGSDSGSFNLDGNTISWYRLADRINLTVTDTDGDLTNILIPIGSLLLPEPTNETTTE